MSRRNHVTSVDHVPRIRPQRSVASEWPTSAAGYHQAPAKDERPGRYLPGQLGRFPTVGLDEGCVKNTRPDTSPINQR